MIFCSKTHPWKEIAKKPVDFEMVDIGVFRDDREVIVPGWWNGRVWEGLRLKNTDKVTRWRKKPHTDHGISLGQNGYKK